MMDDRTPYSSPWSNFIEEEDNERTDKGRTLKRDKNNSRYWLIDDMRFTSFRKAIEYIDKNYPSECPT
jgi:hypothetical protein